MANVLAAQEIAQLAYNAGFRGQALTTAVAVSLAESGGNPSAMGDVGLEDSTWGPSVGLWQVRSINKQKGSGGQRDQNVNTDPAHNALNAYKISGGGNSFAPWSTYKNGAYKKFANVAQLAASQIDPNAAGFDPSMSGGSSQSKPTDGVGQFYSVVKNLLGSPVQSATSGTTSGN